MFSALVLYVYRYDEGSQIVQIVSLFRNIVLLFWFDFIIFSSPHFGVCEFSDHGHLEIHIDILSSLYDDKVTTVILFNLSSAFDNIDH